MADESARLFRLAKELIPGGVNSPVRACGNVHAEPLFIDAAKGAHLWDVDGREFIDFVLSWGPMLLGHADSDVEGAILEAAKKGASFGAPCPNEVWLAREVVEALPAIEMTRMVNSGTEATMSAIRVARGVTGRDRIIKFIGCYHGHADAFLAAAGSGVATFSLPGTPGVTNGCAADTLLAPYNDPDAVKTLLEENRNSVAAIIVEPVAANMGLVLPQKGFLEALRKLCDSHQCLLVFDEVITGFRLGYHGAQGRFQITPDLTTLGKIIGGGLPVGCFGGKRRYMEHVAPAGEIYQAGTLSGNPLAMAAGLATLQKLKNADYSGLEARCLKFASELCQILKGKNVPVQVPAIASMFSVFFSEEPVRNFAQAKKADGRLYEKFYKQMRKMGIYLAPSPFETAMLSFAHTDEDFEKTLDAASKVVF